MADLRTVPQENQPIDPLRSSKLAGSREKRRRLETNPRSLLARRAVLVAVALLLASLSVASPAHAHAELRQASPDVQQTVGGTVHQVVMQFIGLDPDAMHNATLFDPSGNQIEANVIHEGQRIVLPIIEPFTIPGEYLVKYEVNGIDGDFTQESFTFRYDKSAPEPSGITIAVYEEPGFDFVLLSLVLVGAALAAFLVHRFVFALKQHRSEAG